MSLQVDSMHVLRGLLIKARLDSRMLKKRDRDIWSGFVQGENGIIFILNMSGEMHMRRRNEVFGCIPHGRGALP